MFDIQQLPKDLQETIMKMHQDSGCHIVDLIRPVALELQNGDVILAGESWIKYL